jgi:hypothetical protein
METIQSPAKVFEDVRRSIQTMADMVNEGEYNPFEVGRELSYTKNSLEQAKEKIADAEKREYGKFLPEELKRMKIQMAGGGMTWDYKHIKAWVDKKAELTDIEEKAKLAYYNAMKGNLSVNSESGEEIEAATCEPKRQSVSYR